MTAGPRTTRHIVMAMPNDGPYADLNQLTAVPGTTADPN